MNYVDIYLYSFVTIFVLLYVSFFVIILLVFLIKLKVPPRPCPSVAQWDLCIAH